MQPIQSLSTLLRHDCLFLSPTRCEPASSLAGFKSRFACGLVLFLLIQAAEIRPLNAQIAVEAEQGTLSNGADVQRSDKASGGAMVGFVGGDKNGAVLFENVTVARGGRYILTMRYATAEDRSLTVGVNSDRKVRMHCPASGGWFNFATADVEVTLKQGKNTIELDNNRGWAPNIDKLTFNLKSVWREAQIWIGIGLVCLAGILSATWWFVSHRKRHVA